MSSLRYIATGVVFNQAGEVLVQRRPDDAHLGGLWEFPGGKVKKSEDGFTAMVRELHEEVGVNVERARPLIRLQHSYPTRDVDIEVWKVEAWSGDAHGKEGQPTRWVSLDELAGLDMPEANRAIRHAVRLPVLYAITDAPGDEAEFLATLDAVLGAGARMIQLRAKTLDDAAYIDLARKVVAQCRPHGALVMANTTPAVFAATGADGLHLDSRQLMAATEPPVSIDYLFSASCHNAAELAHAESIGADVALLSPMYPTASHPEAEALGAERWAAMVAEVNIPVYALGGMEPQHLEGVFGAGGQGAAVLGGIWKSADPAAAVRAWLG